MPPPLTVIPQYVPDGNGEGAFPLTLMVLVHAEIDGDGRLAYGSAVAVAFVFIVPTLKPQLLLLE